MTEFTGWSIEVIYGGALVFFGTMLISFWIWWAWTRKKNKELCMKT
jgi:hypothetical protein